MVQAHIQCIKEQKKKSGIPTKPTIEISNKNENNLIIKVFHDKEISEVEYYWNDEEPTTIQGNGRKYIEENIEIPVGESTLYIKAKDINMQEIEYQKTYESRSGINISLEVVGNNIKIIANSQEELSYLTYRWDEEEEKRIDATENTIEEEVEIPKGLHKLTVIAVDINNNTETKEQEINGVTKPKLDITTDGAENFVIKASDEQGLERVEFIINGTKKFKLELDGRKELEYSYPLEEEGETRLEVTVYNSNDVTETMKVMVKR